MGKKINEATSTDLPIIAHVVASRALGFRGEAISDMARGLLRTKNKSVLAKTYLYCVTSLQSATIRG